MQKHKILVIQLDGYEATIGDTLMAQGMLNNLHSLKHRSARFLLDHGNEKYTGLGGEHFSSGQSPIMTDRWSAVHFDPEHYDVIQRGTALDPFVVNLPIKSVVFDPTYFDLERAPHTKGIVGWGAHDPGITQLSRPLELSDEILKRFGSYHAADCIYGFTWPNADKTVEVGDQLTRALDQRAQIAQWLFSERFPDWDLAIVVVSELHSVLEPMWHGIDPAHPLHHLPSAPPARAAIESVYQALDRMIGTLTSSLPDTTVVTFTMHGMGPNEADVPTMLLLPELLYRMHFGCSLFTPKPEWRMAENEIALLDENETWEMVMRERLSHKKPNNVSYLRAAWHDFQKRLKSKPRSTSSTYKRQLRASDLPIDWMPTTQYQRYWPKMKAFALPAFYDGRIRINLAGREKHGIIKVEDYETYCLEIESLIMQCRDYITGEKVVQSVERKTSRNPLVLGPTEADLIILWRGKPTGFRHPKFGCIGPAPYRRTGGHTGAYGMAYICGDGLPPGDYGISSSFDVVPSLFELLGERKPQHLAGESLLTRVRNPH